MLFEGSVGIGKVTIAGSTVPLRGVSVYYQADGARLNLIARSESNGSKTYYVRSFDTPANSATCPITLTSTKTQFPSAGGSIDVTIAASDNCLWKLRRSSAWISTRGSVYGLGPRTITLQAPATGLATQQVFTLTVGNASLQLNQPANTTPNYPWTYPAELIASEYDPNSHRLVFVTSNPDQLHVWDVLKGGDIAVISLAAKPVALTLLPNQAAAISHDSEISLVSLSGSYSRKFNVKILATSMVASSAETLHAFDGYGRGVSVSMNLFIPQAVSNVYNVNFRRAKSKPNSYHFYGFDSYLTRKYDGRFIPPSELYSVVTDGCGYRTWFTQNADRWLNACGAAFKTGETASDDGKFFGRLPGLDNVWAAAHSWQAKVFAVTTGSSNDIQFFADESLKYLGKLTLVPSDGSLFVKDISLTNDASQVYAVLMNADPTAPKLEINAHVIGGPTGSCAVTLGEAPAPLPRPAGRRHLRSPPTQVASGEPSRQTLGLISRVHRLVSGTARLTSPSLLIQRLSRVVARFVSMAPRLPFRNPAGRLPLRNRSPSSLHPAASTPKCSQCDSQAQAQSIR